MSDESYEHLTNKNLPELFLWKIDKEKMKIIEGKISFLVFACEYSPNGKYLAVSGNCEVHIFDAENEDHICTLKDHKSFVNAIAFSQDGKLLASGSSDSSIIIYKLEDFSILTQLKNETFVYCICFSHCSNYIYFNGNCGNLQKLDIYNENLVCQSEIHLNHVEKLKISTTGEYILSASHDSIANLINSYDLSVIRTFDHDGVVRTIDFHPTAKIIALGGNSNTITLWDINDNSPIHCINSDGEVYALQFLSSAILVVMSNDGYITSFNIDNLQPLQSIFCNCDSLLFSCAISPNKTKVCCGRCANNTLKVYPINSPYSPSFQSELIEFSKKGDYSLFTTYFKDLTSSFIRKLVNMGLNVNYEQYGMIIDDCWDLVTLNKNNGGNIYEFFDERTNNSDNDD
eukprot:TRINITY_DN1992_c0_g1_i1.p1 TRINITY_DN1992_c0_g1~~TRINITY_DN1992_c0_g1_i1.p1  ORF type:complete len:401 (+),score=83.48 TRINITY_DN1992_c0_g1_i1:118-1320(+)